MEILHSFGGKVVKCPIRVKFTERVQSCICTAPAKQIKKLNYLQ